MRGVRLICLAVWACFAGMLPGKVQAQHPVPLVADNGFPLLAVPQEQRFVRYYTTDLH